MIRRRKNQAVLAKTRTIVRWGLAVLLVLAVAPTTVADDGPPADATQAPSEATHSSPEGRLAALQAIAPEDDPALFIELGRRVLTDLEASPRPELEAEVRSGLGRALRLDEQFNAAVAELEAALDLAGQTNQTELVPTILADLARATFFLGEFDDTLAACQEALGLPSVIGDPDQSWVFRNIAAAAQLQQGDYESAIEMSSTALEDRQRVGDRNAVAILLNNIGVAHMYLGDYDPALEFFHQARMIKSELGETEGVADLLSNIADIKNLQGHLDEAIEIHGEALRLRKESGSGLRIAMSHRSLANALHKSGRHREALDQIDEALQLLRRIDAEPDIAASLAIRAEALAALGRGSEAVAAASESLELARRMGMRGLEVVALDSMLEARVATGELAAALEAQAQAREIEGELMVGEVRSKVAEFQARLDAREKENEIELLRKNNQLQALELRQKHLSRNTLLIGLIGLAVFAAVGWHLFLSKRRRSLDRQRADEALLQSMERYRLLFERNLAGVFQTDLDGRITTANQAFTEMLGYDDPEDLGQRSVSELAADPDEIHRFLREITIERKTPNREITLTRRDGSPVFMLMNAGIITALDGGGRIIETIAIDISERKRAEDNRRRLEVELQQNQKLESLGVLAGGIAHDFNNMLMAILSNLSLAKRSSRESEETLRRLDEAEKVCLRATSLTQQLLTFSKGGRPIRKTTTIAKLVEEAATFTARASNSSIDLRSSSELWPADIDEGQIVQVIQNLVANAMESMPYGGIITVTTDNAHLGDGDIPTLEPGRFVRIDVADTGTGIDESDLDRIFDPFFTTKTGHTGLGLATAFSIARSHGGAIVVRSDPEQGTRFSVFLPAADESRVAAETRADSLTQGHGRLLIMDDDEAVRSAAAELLETIGYSVSTAADGAEAIELYTGAMEDGRPFSAVILDLTVPKGIGGRETMTRLLEIDPGVVAIVSSGYSTDPVMANHHEHGFAGVAVKPYRLSDLARTLRAATEQRKPG